MPPEASSGPRVRNISFHRWLETHDDRHHARWCRELYPWDVIAQIDFRNESLGQEQRLARQGIEYSATVHGKEASYRERTEFHFNLSTLPSSGRPQWEYRSWDEDFKLIAGPDGEFITLFADGQDPSERILSQFMGGNFAAIEEVRSIPVSAMLSRSLAGYSAEEIFGELEHRRRFSWKAERVETVDPHPDFPSKPQDITPLHSKDRDLWILWAFSEEEAHRRALHAGPQCDHLVAIYSVPTFSAHHRCHFSHAEIRSLLSFVRMGRHEGGLRFLPHVRILMNHLQREEGYEAAEEGEDLLKQVEDYDGGRIRIAPLDLHEARAALEMDVRTAQDAAYFFAAANLLNAALSRRDDASGLVGQIPKEVYSFKGRVVEVVEELIRTPVQGVDVDVPPDDSSGLLYARVLGVQFSFKAIPRTPALRDYMTSAASETQEWTGIRLQPVAPLVLDWARQQLS